MNSPPTSLPATDAPTRIRDTSAQDQRLAPRSPWRRRAALGLGGIALIAAAAFGWPALQRMATGGASVSMKRLVIAPVERGSLLRDVAGEGKVVAAFAPTLYAPHAGAVELKVNAGDAVKRGQVIALVSSPELQNRLAQELSNADAMKADSLRAEVDARTRRATLQGNSDNARIDLITAENDLARQQKAFDAGAVSGMQVEHAKDTLEKARIALAQAKSGASFSDDSLKFDVRAKQLAHERQLLLVADLRRQLDALNVRSPVDGRVGQLFIAERAQVAADAKLLSVIDLSALEVQMQVPESFARELAIGMPGDIAGNGKSWKGKVSSVSPEVVDNQVAARLRFEGETPPQLRQNQRLSVRVLIDQRNDVLTVRRGAFVDESGGQYAYVLREGDIAEKTPIRLGASSTSQVEVLDGLKAGDRVVISGADVFGNAARVTVSR